MAIMLRKMKGKTIQKEGQGTEWEHIINLIKILTILFILFSSFHWIIKKRVQHLPAQLTPAALVQQVTPAKLYKVKEGDTLWKIALQHYPNEDPLKAIHEIKQLNKLSSDSIKPGQSIKLP